MEDRDKLLHKNTDKNLSILSPILRAREHNTIDEEPDVEGEEKEDDLLPSSFDAVVVTRFLRSCLGFRLIVRSFNR